MGLTLRGEKGSKLTIEELDNNFKYFVDFEEITVLFPDSGALLDAYLNYLDTQDPSSLKQSFFIEPTVKMNVRKDSSSIETEEGGISSLALIGLVKVPIIPEFPEFLVSSFLNYSLIELNDSEQIQKLVTSAALFGTDSMSYRESLVEGNNPRYAHKVLNTSNDGGYALSVKINWDDSVNVNWAFSYSGDLPS